MTESVMTWMKKNLFPGPQCTSFIMSQTNTSLLDEVVQWSQETCRQELKSVLPKLTISSLMFVVSSKFQRCKLMVHSVTCLHYNTGKITKNNINPVAEMIK